MALYRALSWKPVVIVHVQYAVIQHIIQSSQTTHVSNHTEGVQWWVHHTGHTKNRLALLCLSHLIDVHAIVTGQRASRCQVIRTEESGDDAVLVHFSDCGAINKINQPILVHCNACWKQVRGREWRREVQRKKLVITGKKKKKHVRYAASMPAWLSGQNTMDTCVKLAFPLFRSLQKAKPSIIHSLLFCY